ncbi:MAG: hypothetical protein ACREVL_01345 [Solimonas sp.]
MNQKCIAQIFTWLSAVFALAAGFLWWKSSTAKVKAGKRPNNPDGFQTANIYIGSGNDEYELVETLTRQGMWNRRAAQAASAAAIFQAIALSLSG